MVISNSFSRQSDYTKIKDSIRLLFIAFTLVTIFSLIIGPLSLEFLFPKYFENQSTFIRILLLFPFINSSKSLAVSLLMKKTLEDILFHSALICLFFYYSFLVSISFQTMD